MNFDAGDIVLFYKGGKIHPKGYIIEDIWSWDDDRLDKTKDFMAWLFPADDKMQQRGMAPFLKFEEIKEFKSNLELRTKLIRSFSVILKFYGFELEESGVKPLIRPNNESKERISKWIMKGDPHFRRISQILRSMTLLGCKDHAKAFLDELRKVYSENSARIDYIILKHWRFAASDLND